MSLHVPSLLAVLAASVPAPVIGEFTRRFGLSIVVLFPIAASGFLGPRAASRAAAYADHDGL